ncbi:MAG: transposase family protein, partial [Chloroflexi bacterium]|nr:transposase family protein [Chloroflexota bacterium]
MLNHRLMGFYRIFSLPGWVVRQVELDELMARYHITIEVESEVTSCPLCGATTLPYRFGYREKRLADFPLHMKPVQLVARRRRYQCRVCRGTFLDEMPSIDPRYEATSRLVEYIQAASLHPRRTFAQLASDLGVSETFVRSIF